MLTSGFSFSFSIQSSARCSARCLLVRAAEVERFSSWRDRRRPPLVSPKHTAPPLVLRAFPRYLFHSLAFLPSRSMLPICFHEFCLWFRGILTVLSWIWGVGFFERVEKNRSLGCRRVVAGMGDLLAWPPLADEGSLEEICQLMQPHPAPFNPDPSAISAENWQIAEKVTQDVLRCIQPTAVSEHRRKGVVEYVQKLLKRCIGTEVTFILLVSFLISLHDYISRILVVFIPLDPPCNNFMYWVVIFDSFSICLLELLSCCPFDRLEKKCTTTIFFHLLVCRLQSRIFLKTAMFFLCFFFFNCKTTRLSI